ncbi:MAG: TIGR02302 family protein [Alphaproteobacteria bacterium]|nr:TIGR02302 family protein [Alphaproteobacteria bacterium]
MIKHCSYHDPRPWLQAKLRRTWVVLMWERLWAASWPVTSLAGLFIALAWLDVFPQMPGLAHAGSLGLFALAGAIAISHARRSVKFPRREDLVRRLERGSSHYPLTAIDDTLAAGTKDPAAQQLWQAHITRMIALAHHLEPGIPSPGVPARDPLGLRAAVLLLLTIAITAGWGQLPERMGRALHPTATTPATASASVLLRLWITPPPYTRLPPLVLETPSGANPNPLDVPEGSRGLALVLGGDETPSLAIGNRVVPFTPLADTSHRLETIIDGGSQLAVTQGHTTLGQWAMRVITDTPPETSFTAPPAEASRWRLRLAYKAHDDYAVAGVSALIHRVDHPDGTPMDIELPLPGGKARDVHDTSLLDLTAHEWAGMPVTIRLYARDDKGQTGMSQPTTTRLPDRVFTHPMARAIVVERKRLITEPAQLANVLERLDTLSAQPEKFGRDIVVFLALRVARDRLALDVTDASLASVRDILWQTALHIEDGQTATAERSLDDAEKVLSEALKAGADPAELDRLVDRYREALDRYLQTLAQRLDQETLRPPLRPDGPVMRPEDFARRLDRLKDLSLAGARQAAQEMLRDLQRMTQSLRNARMPSEVGAAMKAAQAVMDGLKAIIDRQQKLLDDTFHQSQDLRRTVDRERMRRTAASQNGVRHSLGELMQRLGEMGVTLPKSLGSAELSMRDAATSLRSGDPTAAAAAQGRALASLRQGSGEALKALMENALGGDGSPMMLLPGPGSSRNGAGLDPLGRTSGGIDDGSGIAIPTQPDARTAREILDELRKRASDRERPKPELDYLERLLRQF